MHRGRQRLHCWRGFDPLQLNACVGVFTASPLTVALEFNRNHTRTWTNKYLLLRSIFSSSLSSGSVSLVLLSLMLAPSSPQNPIFQFLLHILTPSLLTPTLSLSHSVSPPPPPPPPPAQLCHRSDVVLMMKNTRPLIQTRVFRKCGRFRKLFTTRKHDRREVNHHTAENNSDVTCHVTSAY